MAEPLGHRLDSLRQRFPVPFCLDLVKPGHVRPNRENNGAGARQLGESLVFNAQEAFVELGVGFFVGDGLLGAGVVVVAISAE